ncbi:hypothetical protein K469DRAFT_597014 [Zopfia rhizophila CBS 207.26]|uniref:Zn(2)-C6 fungal-type domain-containing protein n=1 Tax=Zopfia rhizophila CBS 207.26 TaxID=1314779 RepID=A0A6A6DMI6_9PEZI|nr:hypothetical protein K469DRAFT_597014 [Zopfia rhizophila CBS 207.26]
MAEQRVAKRKPHTKSRKGCFQCKQRHTKCSEEHPRCAKCTHLDIHCTWPTISNRQSLSPPFNPGNHVYMLVEHRRFGSPDLVTPGASPELSIPDLRLLHHWTTEAYKTLQPGLVSKHSMWQNDFPELGFEYPFLLHGILALSAVHKAVSDPLSNKQSLLLQADSHISWALSTYRKYLQTPTTETVIPMFMLSTLLVTYSLAATQSGEPEDPIGVLHHCFRLLKGISVTGYPHWQHIKSSEVFSNLAGTILSNLESLDTRAGDEETPAILQLEELADLLDFQDKDACMNAINELHTTSVQLRKALPDCEEYTILFVWPAKLTDHFLGLLSVRNPVACVIVGYYAALLAQGCPVWWIGEWPHRVITATQQVLAWTPELLKWLEWPMQIIHPTA